MPSKSKRRKVATLFPIQVPNMDRDKLTATITLPDVKNISTYFHNFCARLRSKQITVTVKKREVSIASEDEETMNKVRSTIQREIEKFVGSQQGTVKVLPRKTFSLSKPKQLSMPSKSIIPRTCGCGRPRYDHPSSNTKTKSYEKRRFWNKIAQLWKHWYVRRLKLNAKFKAVQKYISLQYPRRADSLSLYRQVKRAPHEYRQSKVVGRKRDRLRMKRVQKRRKKPKAWNKKSRRRRKINTSKRPLGVASKLSHISLADFQQRTLASSKNETKRTSEGGYKLGQCFPYLPPTHDTFTNDRKSSIQYRDQRLLVYATPIGAHRSRKKDLVFTMSTLNTSETPPVPQTKRTRSHPKKASKPSLQVTTFCVPADPHAAESAAVNATKSKKSRRVRKIVNK